MNALSPLSDTLPTPCAAPEIGPQIRREQASARSSAG